MLKLWFKRVTQADGNVPPNVEYIYFDHNEWQRQFFAGNVQMIVSVRTCADLRLVLSFLRVLGRACGPMSRELSPAVL